MNFEYVYILTNPCMPDWVKVGKTNNIERRIEDLNCTAVPLPFECFAYLKVPAVEVFNVERAMHTFLGYSFRKEKEFFKTSPERVLEFFNTAKLLNSVYEVVSHPSFDDEAEHKSVTQTTFELLGIPVGSQLVFTRDSSVVCTVADKTNQVRYMNKQYSISGLAVELLSYNANGYKYFMFEDETLWARRVRLIN